MADQPSTTLGTQILRTTWLFQGIVAFPVTIALGSEAFYELTTRYASAYDFTYAFLNALMAAGIIFLLLIELRIPTSPRLKLHFEAAKSLLATSLWLWLILDAQFGPWQRKEWQDPGIEKPAKVARAGIAGVLLLVLFYPALGYCWVEWRREREGKSGSEEREGEGERAPLLGGRDGS